MLVSASPCTTSRVCFALRARVNPSIQPTNHPCMLMWPELEVDDGDESIMINLHVQQHHASCTTHDPVCAALLSVRPSEYSSLRRCCSTDIFPCAGPRYGSGGSRPDPGDEAPAVSGRRGGDRDGLPSELFMPPAPATAAALAAFNSCTQRGGRVYWIECSCLPRPSSHLPAVCRLRFGPP